MATETENPPIDIKADDVKNETNLPPPPETETPPTPEGEEKRRPGRPSLSDEEKAQRAAERKIRDGFGDMFDQPPTPPEDSPINGSSTVPKPEGEKEAKRVPKPRRENGFETFAELIVFNQYGLMGVLFDHEEANPLTKNSDGSLRNPFGNEIHASVKISWSEYLKANSDGKEVDPGTVLFLSNTAYVVSVLAQPKSSAKMKAYLDTAWAWVKSYFS